MPPLSHPTVPSTVSPLGGSTGSFVGEAKKSGRRRVDAQEAQRGLPLDPNHLTRAPTADLVTLPSVDEAMILHNLQRRFAADEIYTSIGSILISLNPFKPLPLFTPAQVRDLC